MNSTSLGSAAALHGRLRLERESAAPTRQRRVKHRLLLVVTKDSVFGSESRRIASETHAATHANPYPRGQTSILRLVTVPDLSRVTDDECRTLGTVTED